MSSLDINSYAHQAARRNSGGRANAKRLPLALIVLPLCFLIPVDFSFYIQDLRLDAYRLALFAFLIPALTRVASDRAISLNFFDFGVLAYATWIVLALIHHMGFAQGLESGGIIALETISPYLIARAYLTDLDRIQRFLRFLIFLSLVVASIMTIEMIVGKNLVRILSSTLMGGGSPVLEIGRFGLVRARGPFTHPIHAGIMAGGLLAVHWLTNPRNFRRWLIAIIMGVGVFASVSSGPFIMFLSQLGLLIYNKICDQLLLPKRWLLLVGAGLALFVALQVGSNRGAVLFLIQNLAFNAWTGFYRTLQWDYGSAEVLRNPLWGIGFGDWLRPSWMRMNTSIDAYWLATAMRYGLPSLLFLVSSIILIWRSVAAHLGNHTDLRLQKISLAWLIVFFAWCFVGFTVHFWAHAYVFFFLLLGIGAAIGNITVNKPDVSAQISDK